MSGVPGAWRDSYEIWARTTVQARAAGRRAPRLTDPVVERFVADLVGIGFAVFAFFALFSWLHAISTV
jgi:hypothetical protein